jgi:hypothetical protein
MQTRPIHPVNERGELRCGHPALTYWMMVWIDAVAMAVPKHRTAWLAYIDEFIKLTKASGLLQRVIELGALRRFTALIS